MYLQDSYKNLRRAPRQLTDTKSLVTSKTGKNVLALGFTSLFTDISSEMVIAILPLYLTGTLGFSIIGFGIFEGAYQLANISLRLWGGSRADSQNNHKNMAAAGYGISTLSKIGLFISTFFPWIPAIFFLLTDRVGKGIRVAPRDALLSLSVPATMYATAFGIHRTLDTFGALLGPIVAYLLLAYTPGAFDGIFLFSAVIATIGVTILWLFATQIQVPKKTATISNTKELLKTVSKNRNLRLLCLATGALGFMSVSDSFIYLLLLREGDFNLAYFPLFYSGTACIYLLFAIPVGRIADRFGRRILFLSGHLLLLFIYLILITGEITLTNTAAVLLALGLFYAMTDGVIASIISMQFPPSIRGTSLGFIGITTAVAKLFSAALFGILWQTSSSSIALTVFSIGLLASLSLASQLFSEVRKEEAS